MDYGLIGMILVFFTGLVFIVGAFTMEQHFENDVQDLGGAICEEKYGMEFEKYDHKNKRLECKNKVQYTKYDGLKVKLKEG